MSDDDDRPRIQFRDKDNDAPTPKPRYTRTNNPHLAPSGMMGVRPSQAEPYKAPQAPRQDKPGLSLDNTLFGDDARYTDGKILTMPGYTFMVRLADEPSKMAMDGGRIEQMVVRKDDKPVAVYNRGWVQDPKTADHREAIHRIRNGLDDTRQQDFKGFDHTQSKDKSHGFDR